MLPSSTIARYGPAVADSGFCACPWLTFVVVIRQQCLICSITLALFSHNQHIAINKPPSVTSFIFKYQDYNKQPHTTRFEHQYRTSPARPTPSLADTTIYAPENYTTTTSTRATLTSTASTRTRVTLALSSRITLTSTQNVLGSDRHVHNGRPDATHELGGRPDKNDRHHHSCGESNTTFLIQRPQAY